MKTLKYAWRFLIRTKSYTIINLLGLAFSMACCIILVRYIHRELTVDSHCINAETIIAPLMIDDDKVFFSRLTDENNDEYINDFISERCRMSSNKKQPFIYKQLLYQLDMLAVDSTFFHFFDYPLVAGEKEIAATNMAVITHDAAKRMFGKENPVGKSIKRRGNDLVIVGVIDNPKCKTMLYFDILVSYNLTGWGNNTEILRVHSNMDLEKANAKNNTYNKGNAESMQKYEFATWKQFYWEGDRVNTFNALIRTGNRGYMVILSGVAFLLLLVGILNFINLYMIFMMKRSKEQGIKKVFGLQNGALFVQIWIENLQLVLLSLLVAWLLIEITNIPVSNLMGEEIPSTSFDWQLSLGILLLLPLTTSVYPYLKYNYRSPIVSIRSIATTRHAVIVRMSFLFFQYAITFLLIVLSLYFNSHLDFLLNTPTGYRSKGILEANLIRENYWIGESKEATEARKTRLVRIDQSLNECPHIAHWSLSYPMFSAFDNYDPIFNDKGKESLLVVKRVVIDFFKLYDVKIVEGKLPLDNNWNMWTILLNQAAMKELGYARLEDALVRSKYGLWVEFKDGKPVDGGKELMPVTAVVEDFYLNHITEGIKPMLLVVAPPIGNYTIVAKDGKEKELIDYLKNMEKKIYGSEEFGYSWISDQVKNIYKEDRQIATIYSVFALIAITISCLGLFGLSLFDIQQRYREIAIRKINGARLKDLYILLCRKYVLILVEAFIVAVPVSYYIIYKYTEEFVMKAPVSLSIYLVALLVTVGISLGTLLWQIHKAANINPAKIIKSE